MHHGLTALKDIGSSLTLLKLEGDFFFFQQSTLSNSPPGVMGPRSA